MRMIDQPPPGPDYLEELPPDGWRGMSTRQFWTRMMVGGVMLLIATLVAVPVVFGHRGCGRHGERVRAINNAKQVGLALLEFDQEYGSYPSPATAADVKKQTGTSLDLSGSSSNAMFRQLIAMGIMSEDIFYCQHPEGIRKPDRDISVGRALQAGEVGFSYVAGLDSSMYSMNPEIPLVMAPMKIGTRQFWRKPYQDKAVILRLDNSVDVPVIRRSDGGVDVGGRDLFDTSAGSPWPKGHVINLRHPEK